MYKFNGNNFRKLKTDEPRDSSATSNISGITEDQNGSVIVVTHPGKIYRWNSETQILEDTYFTSKRLNSGSVKLLFKEKNTLFLSTRSGLEIATLGSFKNFQWVGELLKEKITGEIVDGHSYSDQYLIFIDTNTIYILCRKTKSLIQINIPNHFQEISASQTLPDNSLLVATKNNNLITYSLESLKITKHINLEIGNQTQITDIAVEASTIWIGTNNGIYLTDLNGVILAHFNQKNSDLSHDYITKLQPEDQLWIGTFQGINRGVNSKIITFTPDNSEIYSDVLAFEEDKLGNFWIGTYNGLFKTDSKYQNLERVTWLDSYNHPLKIMTLALREDKLWIGLQDSGLIIANISTSTYEPFYPELLKSTQISKILHDNSRTWISTFDNGVYLFEDTKPPTHFEPLDNPSFIGLYKISTDFIFASAEQGLYRINIEGSSFERMGLFDEYGTELKIVIFSILEGSNGNIYFGTKDHGVYVTNIKKISLDDIVLRRLSSQDELLEKTVYGILEGLNSHIWASTNKGVFKLSQSGETISRLTASNGLQDNDFNYGSYFKSSNNDIIFGGVRGFSVIDQKDTWKALEQPNIYINSVSGPGFSWAIDPVASLKTELKIPEYRNDFSIVFSVADFVDPKLNRYKYRLFPTDTSWTDSGNINVASYSSLPVGKYTFKVIGANANGAWNTAGATIDFQIVGNWWKSKLAYLAYITILFVLFWLILRTYRIHILKNQALERVSEMERGAFLNQNELEEERDYQDGVIDAIKTQNHAIMDIIKTCILDTNSSPVQYKKIASQLDLLQEIEQFYVYQTGYLGFDLHTFVENIVIGTLVNKEFDNHHVVVINSTSRQIIPANIGSTLAVIIFELASNSLRHGFVADSPVNYIDIFFALNSTDNTSNHYFLRYSDDGIGFPQGIDPLSVNSTGLSLVRSLSQSFHGDLSDRSTDEQTILCLSIPMPVTH
ncbi:ligand-binding sensor domain-containing protein [Haliea sp. E17]|uniref:ligand-binding sensor domain-containing protein n=1 Tax=Haliea sp. E17 TaxID=3401576 RepID=UPI003AAE2990